MTDLSCSFYVYFAHLFQLSLHSNVWLLFGLLGPVFLILLLAEFACFRKLTVCIVQGFCMGDRFRFLRLCFSGGICFFQNRGNICQCRFVLNGCLKCCFFRNRIWFRRVLEVGRWIIVLGNLLFLGLGLELIYWITLVVEICFFVFLRFLGFLVNLVNFSGIVICN